MAAFGLGIARSSGQAQSDSYSLHYRRACSNMGEDVVLCLMGQLLSRKFYYRMQT